MSSAESNFAASSKLLRVLVLASKNNGVTNFPCRAGNFLVPWLVKDLKRVANSRTEVKSSIEKADRSRM